MPPVALRRSQIQSIPTQNKYRINMPKAGVASKIIQPRGSILTYHGGRVLLSSGKRTVDRRCSAYTHEVCFRCRWYCRGDVIKHPFVFRSRFVYGIPPTHWKLLKLFRKYRDVLKGEDLPVAFLYSLPPRKTGLFSLLEQEKLVAGWEVAMARKQVQACGNSCLAGNLKK